ncbi:hypothetical protein BPODLACK_01958 [Gordonia sp. YY1]|nr:hypothetical protein BPODLACK_01958 [Gordonia sp. YY1]
MGEIVEGSISDAIKALLSGSLESEEPTPPPAD